MNMNNKTKNNEGLMKTVLIFSAIICVCLVGDNYSKLSEYNQSETWARAEAEVVASEVKLKTITKQTSKNHSSYKTVKYPYIEYVWATEKGMTTGHRIDFKNVGFYDNAAEAAAIIADYKVGDVLNIYYNQEAPEHSVIKRELSESTKFTFYTALLGLLLITFYYILRFTTLLRKHS